MILVTGFEPFGNSDINPSQLILQALQKKFNSSYDYDFLLLPVDYDLGPQKLIQQIRSKKYKAWIGFGQAGGRSKISLERVAINWREKDFNQLSFDSYFQPGPLIENAPTAYIFQEDLNTLKQKLLDQNIPTEVSFSAGSYVCNAVYFFAMNEKIKSLFVHVPYIPEQNQKDQPSLSLDQQILAAEILIKNIS